MKFPECRWLNLEHDTTTGWLGITLDAPKQRNALSKPLSTELMRVLGQVSTDPSVRGISLRGAGGVFSAGGDIKSFSGTNEQTRAMSLCGAELFSMLARQPQPTIALVEGLAAGGGVGLTAACDFVIATPEARFVLSEVRLGVIAAQIAPYLVARMGVSRTRQLMLTGKILAPEVAQDYGLVDRLVRDASELEITEAEIKSDILAGAPGAISASKALLAMLGAEDYCEKAADMFVEALNSQEAREGVAAFIQKRKPDWSKA